MPLDPITRALSLPVEDLDGIEELARVLAEIDGRRLLDDPLAAELYRIEAQVLLPYVLEACLHS